MNENEFSPKVLRENEDEKLSEAVEQQTIKRAIMCDKNCNECGIEPLCTEKGNNMESADRIEITFKSGETISYGKDEWDDYAYDGKAVIVKQKGAWIGIYNFNDVFCVELKEK